MDHRRKKMYFWHSIEELEHSSVTEDLLSFYGKPNLFVQIFRNISTFFGIIFELTFRAIVFSWKEGLFKKNTFYKEIFAFFFLFKYFPKFILTMVSALMIENPDSNSGNEIKKIVNGKFRFI